MSCDINNSRETLNIIIKYLFLNLKGTSNKYIM